ncbi:MAG: hypothetical protein KAS66_05415 [Candidatus Omnitrophica bacterium]|nr:hypothetical protein [Candidatus Omnitrophota bacterium]
MHTFTCWDKDRGIEPPKNPHELKALDFEDAATEYAEYSYRERDGWEWMQKGCAFYINDGEETREVKITVEHEPVFYAEEIET